MGHTYDCLEYLPDRSRYHFNLSARALDVLSCTLPLLSKLVIDLDVFNGYSRSWDQAYKRAAGISPTFFLPLEQLDGLNMVYAIARFQGLRHLNLHYKLQRDQVALMHPTLGCGAVRELFESIQSRKRGRALVRLDVVFYTDSKFIFGPFNGSWGVDPPTVSTTMTIVCNSDNSSPLGNLSPLGCTCDDPRYRKVIERQMKTSRLYGDLAWSLGIGNLQWKLLQDRYRKSLRSVVMESAMWLVLFPSNLIFEEGKRVRYEPSLSNVDVSCYRVHSKRRKGRILTF